MHEISVKLWTPNTIDTTANFKWGFGATTNVINGGLECNIKGKQKPKNRRDYMRKFATYFGIAKDHSYLTKNTLCETTGGFKNNGAAGKRKLYWKKNANGRGCVTTTKQKKWAVWSRDAYTNCSA